MAAGKSRPHGQVRQSQVITTFGPGAMVDLPHHAVIIGGLEHWQPLGPEIREDRLVARLREELGVPGLVLRAPPVDLASPSGEHTSGLTAWRFPEWFVAQYEEKSGGVYRSRPLVHARSLVKDAYLGPDRRSYPVQPIRWVQACKRGHISDIDWYAFVHKGEPGCRRPLWLDERGTTGDLADLFVRCECKQIRPLVDATYTSQQPLGLCRGYRPWLGPHAQEPCGGPQGPRQPNRLLVRSASNAWFPQVLSAIHIPDGDERLRQAVDSLWEDHLQYIESVAELTRERRRQKVAVALEGFADAVVMREIERRKAGLPAEARSIKQAELEMLLASSEDVHDDVPESDFHARALPRSALMGRVLEPLERVVLVHRLREVMVQVGFTRFEPLVPDIDGELDLEVGRAELAQEVSWLPAVENRGEGVFISFRKDKVDEWLRRPEVEARGRQLEAGFNARPRDNTGTKVMFPGLPYIFLHSLSHLLLSTVSLVCGYAATSIRERIYAGSAGYGILLYTGTPDAEGTLGGLVQVGRRLGAYLEDALELGRLCSNDPVCAAHEPDDVSEARFLHGAACHGCLLIAEPSCERRNEYLDRALVVATVQAGAEFFREGSG